MSNYQVGIYEMPELLKEMKKKETPKNPSATLIGIYADTTSTYRIFSRAFCNFVFPKRIRRRRRNPDLRPMPRDGSTIEDAISSKKRKK